MPNCTCQKIIQMLNQKYQEIIDEFINFILRHVFSKYFRRGQYLVSFRSVLHSRLVSKPTFNSII